MTTATAEGVRTQIREALYRIPGQPGLAAAILTDAAEKLRREAAGGRLTGVGKYDTGEVVSRHWADVQARNKARRGER